MSIGLLGKKVGMTRVFTDNGESIPVTVLKIETNIVSMIKSIDSDGYNALQLSTVELKENKTKKPHLGHFKKNNITPQKNIKEFRVENISEISIGQEFEAEYFEEGTFVNVRSRSKGKGFAGTIKRHNFKGKDATHGNSISHRTPGSTGQCQFPGRVFKGKKMAGHMGDEMVTKKNLQIVKVDIDKKLPHVIKTYPGSKVEKQTLNGEACIYAHNIAPNVKLDEVLNIKTNSAINIDMYAFSDMSFSLFDISFELDEDMISSFSKVSDYGEELVTKTTISTE